VQSEEREIQLDLVFFLGLFLEASKEYKIKKPVLAMFGSYHFTNLKVAHLNFNQIVSEHACFRRKCFTTKRTARTVSYSAAVMKDPVSYRTPVHVII
jgi:hypothetical protein